MTAAAAPARAPMVQQCSSGPAALARLRRAAPAFSAVLAALLLQAAAHGTLTLHSALWAAVLAAAAAAALHATSRRRRQRRASSPGAADLAVTAEVSVAPAAAKAAVAPAAAGCAAAAHWAAAAAGGVAKATSAAAAANQAEAAMDPRADQCSPCSSGSGSDGSSTPCSSGRAAAAAGGSSSCHAAAPGSSAADGRQAAAPASPPPVTACTSPQSQPQQQQPVLLSDPEPDWLNADIKQRFIQAKSSLKASRDQAALAHAWRARMGVGSILAQPPGPWFEFVIDNFTMHIIKVEANGDMSLLVRLSEMRRLTDALRAGKGTLRDLELHLAFINQYLFTRRCPQPLPGGLQYLVVDCAGARLSMISADAIAAFRVFAAMGLYYPERLGRVVIVNAPGWVDIPWRIAHSILDENTRSKVVLDFDRGRTQAELEAIFGPGKVPVELGGTCTDPTRASPEMARLHAFVAQLREAGGGGSSGSGPGG